MKKADDFVSVDVFLSLLGLIGAATLSVSAFVFSVSAIAKLYVQLFIN